MKTRELKIVSPCRAPNFSPREVETMIYQLELKPELIRASARVTREGGKKSLSMKDKIDIWNEIANLVNIEGSSETTGVVRTAYDVKRKWNDLKSRVKIKAEDLRRGKLSDIKTPLSHLEERVLQLILKTGKDTDGLNSLLPPAYFHVGGKRRLEKLITSSPSEEEVDSPSEDSETKDMKIVNVENFGTFVTVPTVNTMPIITVAAPSTALNYAIQEEPKSSNKNETIDEDPEKWDKDTENSDSDQNYSNNNTVLEMLNESQQQLEYITKELNDIKKTMFRISRQKQKRIEQENIKIQLKKMKLMIKCKEQGLDFDEILSDFM